MHSRSPVSRRRPQAGLLLPCDDDDNNDDGAKHKPTSYNVKYQICLRTANFGAVLMNLIVVVLFLNSGALSSKTATESAKVVAPTDTGSPGGLKQAAPVQVQPLVQVVQDAANNLRRRDEDLSEEEMRLRDREEETLEAEEEETGEEETVEEEAEVEAEAEVTPVQEEAAEVTAPVTQDTPVAEVAIPVITPVQVHHTIPVRGAASTPVRAAVSTTNPVHAVTPVTQEPPVSVTPVAVATTPVQVHHTFPVRGAATVTTPVRAAVSTTNPVHAVTPVTQETPAAVTPVVTTPLVTTPVHAHHTFPIRGAVGTHNAIPVRAAADADHPAIQLGAKQNHHSIVLAHADVYKAPAPDAVSTTAPLATTTTTTAATTTRSSSDMQPLTCRDYLHQVKSKTYLVPVHDPNDHRDTYIRRTKTAYPFRMSFHHEEFDRPRWQIYKKGYYYEKKLEKIWTNILEHAGPGARVLDVGASTGYYSLLSASVGLFHVDAFEPNMKNNLRFCESVIMNGWEHETNKAGKATAVVNVWPVGLSDMIGTKKFYEWNGNPGAGHFEHPGHPRTDFSDLPVTTLDAFATAQGWFQEGATPPKISILKMDVEHHETNVITGAEKLLKSGMVKNVFVDLFLDEASDKAAKTQAIDFLVSAGYKLKGQGGFAGPEHDTLWNNDENLGKNMMDYFEKHKYQNWNLWWTLK